MEIKDVLFKLSNACAIGTIDDAALAVMVYFARLRAKKTIPYF